MVTVIQLVVGLVFAIVCALVAQSRGRSAVGWFFIGFFFTCIGLIVLLVIPDLRIQEERERRLADENRRLRERLRKDRMVADSRHAEVQKRLRVHDQALGVDTSAQAALPGAPPEAQPLPGVDAIAAGELRAASWYWASAGNRRGPVLFQELQSLWQQGSVTPETLVWRSGMAKWTAVRDLPDLESVLDE